MTLGLSLNTRAILLLTAPLLAGTGTALSSDLLAPREYKLLARQLRDRNCEPADLIATDARPLLRALQTVIDENRLQRLLGRGFLLSQVIERWRARAIWVISRADPEYPRALKNRLKEDAPAVLYGCGNMGLLDGDALAVVGSRHVDGSLIEYAQSIGRLAAGAGRSIVSGGAKGIDQAAMSGALEAGGRAIGILADSLERASLNREHRDPILENRLVLVSPYDPGAGFNVGQAMQRNKLIYAFAQAALVVNSDLNKGGTWAGAVEQLDKLRFVPVYVRSTAEPSAGLEGLRRKGALPWPNPATADILESIFNGIPETGSQPNLSFSATETPDAARMVREPPPAPFTQPSPADALFVSIRETILRLLHAPMKDTEVAAALNVSNAQAKVWLNRLVEEGFLEKQKKPAVYISKQRGLFE